MQEQDLGRARGRWDGSASFIRDIEAMRLRIDALRVRTDPTSTDQDHDVMLAELDTAHEELRVAEEEVRAQQEELTALMQGQRNARAMQERFIAVLPAPVLVTDQAGLVHTANAAAAGLLGLRIDRLLGKPVFVFISPEDRPTLRQALVSALSEDRSEFGSVVSVVGRGHDLPVRVEVAATIRSEGPEGQTEITWVMLGHRPEEHNAPATELERFVGARLATALVGLTQASMTHATGDVLSEVAVICQGAFSRPVAVSVTVGEPASPETVATGSKLAQNIDGAQMVAGEGPCQQCWTERRTVHSSNFHQDERWPRLAGHLSESPVRSVIAVPIEVGDELVGALNIYSVSAELVDDAAIESAELLGASVAAIFHEAQVKDRLQVVAAQLETALQSRATIDQAKGILMARHGCDADQAFRILADASSSANVKLREIAERLVSDTADGTHQDRRVGR
jgi:PAS domain S-box-containing protein